MKFSAFFAAGALALAVPTLAQAQETPAPQTLSRTDLARDIVEYGYPEDARMAMFTSFVGELLSQFAATIPGAQNDPAMRAVFEVHSGRVVSATEEVLTRHMDALMDSLVIAYAESFSLEELEGLHTFIMSPAGRGFLARSTAVAGHPAFAQANQDYMADYMQLVPAMQESLRSDVTRMMRERQGS